MVNLDAEVEVDGKSFSVDVVIAPTVEEFSKGLYTSSENSLGELAKPLNGIFSYKKIILYPYDFLNFKYSIKALNNIVREQSFHKNCLHDIDCLEECVVEDANNLEILSFYSRNAQAIDIFKRKNSIELKNIFITQKQSLIDNLDNYLNHINPTKKSQGVTNFAPNVEVMVLVLAYACHRMAQDTIIRKVDTGLVEGAKITNKYGFSVDADTLFDIPF